MRVILFMLLLSTVTGCIGTDIVDYPLGSPPSHAEIVEGSVTLEADASYTLSFRLIANDGTILPATWEWSSRNEAIATVDQNGIITAVSKGQTWVDGIAQQEFADSVLVTVTSDPDDIASVTIDGDNTNMALGETRQLTALVKTAAGDIVDEPVTWASSNATIIDVDANGLVTANKEGSASINARFEDVLSEPFVIVVGDDGDTRTGEFSGRNGYNAGGTVTLEVSGQDAVLKFGSDFTTQNGPGLHIYLSRSEANVSNAIDLGAIQSTSGAQEYELPMGSNPELYDYVIIWCKPFGVLFGAATLE